MSGSVKVAVMRDVSHAGRVDHRHEGFITLPVEEVEWLDCSVRSGPARVRRNEVATYKGDKYPVFNYHFWRESTGECVFPTIVISTWMKADPEIQHDPDVSRY